LGQEEKPPSALGGFIRRHQSGSAFTASTLRDEAVRITCREGDARGGYFFSFFSSFFSGSSSDVSFSTFTPIFASSALTALSIAAPRAFLERITPFSSRM
jgi:hypothetical protein